jgi:hypothetical protein
VLGLIFLKFAGNKYRQHEAAIVQEYEKLKGTRREKSLEEIAIEKCGFFLHDYARYRHHYRASKRLRDRQKRLISGLTLVPWARMESATAMSVRWINSMARPLGRPCWMAYIR